MGDRANVIITSSDNVGSDLCLYTHWNGSNAEVIVQAGIAHAVKVGRHTDGTYAQRILVDTFFRAHDSSYADGTGAGIYAGQPFESHVVTVNLDDQTVTFDPACYEYGPQNGTITESFAEFIARDLDATAAAASLANAE